MNTNSVKMGKSLKKNNNFNYHIKKKHSSSNNSDKKIPLKPKWDF